MGLQNPLQIAVVFFRWRNLWLHIEGEAEDPQDPKDVTQFNAGFSFFKLDHPLATNPGFGC